MDADDTTSATLVQQPYTLPVIAQYKSILSIGPTIESTSAEIRPNWATKAGNGNDRNKWKREIV